MRADLSSLKAEADALASAFPRLTTRAGAASSAQPGAAGRKRAGSGEHFWQYRAFNQEDGAHRVDWRRSARGDQLYVRETELETARTFLFWIDPTAGFHWRSADEHPTKAGRAAVLFMALSSLLSRAGERCGALGGPRKATTGQRAPLMMAEDLWGLDDDAPFPDLIRDPATIFIASDFYSSLEIWKQRLAPLAAKNRNGVLLAVSDPIETGYPFEGRVRFSRPGQKSTRLIGRAETLKDAYLERFEQRRKDIRDLANELGWRVALHETTHPPAPALAALAGGVVEGVE